MKKSIFFSWQSDLPNRENRSFIEKCIMESIKSMSSSDEIKIYMEYDRDTKGLSGSPDISNAIFEKIQNSTFFVCDISIINSNETTRKCPNPNVLIELGYAARVLGWERIICFYNLKYGVLDDLPFDLRQKRILPYNSDTFDENKRIMSILKENIRNLYAEGKLFNPLNDYMKGKIDKCFLDILKRFANIIFSTFTMAEGLNDVTKLLNLSFEEIEKKISMITFPGYIVLNTYRDINDELRNILNSLFTSRYFSKEWAIIVLKLIDWIRIYKNITSFRYTPYPIAFLEDRINYVVISANSINPENRIDSKLILETYDIDGKRTMDKGRVMYTTNYSEKDLDNLIRYCRFNENSIDLISKQIYDLQLLGNEWLDISGAEFILDPDTYLIH